mmetsp:Transcript_57476/g.120204  ORF Transcript_57476/g.120204 Transcript_57476/m.120204 type:complete len:243 (-) Transcript_57476:426-1154(-)
MSALEALNLVVSSCMCAFWAASSSVFLDRLASSSMRALTALRRRSSPSISSSSARHSLSNSIWFFIISLLKWAIFRSASSRVSSATFIASIAMAISAFFEIKAHCSLLAICSKLSRSFRKCSISARSSLLTERESLNFIKIECTRISSLASFLFSLWSGTYDMALQTSFLLAYFSPYGPINSVCFPSVLHLYPNFSSSSTVLSVTVVFDCARVCKSAILFETSSIAFSISSAFLSSTSSFAV